MPLKVIFVCLFFVTIISSYVYAHESTEIDSVENKYSYFGSSFGGNVGFLGDHFGLSFDFTTPYYNESLALSFLAGIYLVDSKMINVTENTAKNATYSSDYHLYQIFGMFRVSLVGGYIGSSTKNFLRGYAKLGPSFVLLRDKSWKDYYNTLFQLPKNNDNGPDLIVGIHGLIGFEFLFYGNSIFIEAGYEFFFDGFISPGTALLDNSKYHDVPLEYNFVFTIGTKYYF